MLPPKEVLGTCSRAAQITPKAGCHHKLSLRGNGKWKPHLSPNSIFCSYFGLFILQTGNIKHNIKSENTNFEFWGHSVQYFDPQGMHPQWLCQCVYGLDGPNPQSFHHIFLFFSFFLFATYFLAHACMSTICPILLEYCPKFSEY